jgi:hypothetical protein
VQRLGAGLGQPGRQLVELLAERHRPTQLLLPLGRLEGLLLHLFQLLAQRDGLLPLLLQLPLLGRQRLLGRGRLGPGPVDLPRQRGRLGAGRARLHVEGDGREDAAEREEDGEADHDGLRWTVFGLVKTAWLH